MSVWDLHLIIFNGGLEMIIEVEESAVRQILGDTVDRCRYLIGTSRAIWFLVPLRIIFQRIAAELRGFNPHLAQAR